MSYAERTKGKLTGRWVCDAEYRHFDGSKDRWHKAFPSKGEADGAEAYFRATGTKPPHLVKVPSNSFLDVSTRFRAKNPDWIKDASSEQRLKFAEDHLGKIPVNMIRHKVLEDYVDTVLSRCGVAGKPPANRTVNYYLDAVSKVLRYAHKLDLIEGMPAIPRLQSTGKTREALSWSQEDAICDALGRQGMDTEAFLIRVLAATGMRRGELFGLDPEQITVDHEHPENSGVLLRAEQTKTNQARWVPICVPLAAERLKVLTRQGLPKDTHVSLVLREASQALGDDPAFTTHCLRHTTATRLKVSGASDLDTAELLGHSTGLMTQRYYHPDKLRLFEVAKKVQNRLGENGPVGNVVPYVHPMKSTA